MATYVVHPRPPQDVIGTAGEDTVVYERPPAGVRVKLAGEQDATAYMGGYAEHTVRNVENVTASAGEDHITGDDGPNTIKTMAGHDTIVGSLGADTHEGGTGRDTFRYEVAAHTVGDVITDFKAGVDRLDLSALGELSHAEGPAERSLWVVHEGGDTRVLGCTGNDPSAPDIDLRLQGVRLTLSDLGLSGPITGPLSDSLGDEDTLEGGAGDDKLKGYDGDDALYGGNGNDRLWGQNGDDALYGDAGNDEFAGGDGDDALYGGVGHDKLWGGNGNDALYGGNGNDRLWGQNGDDALYGDAGNDEFAGGDGDDALYGGVGHDKLWGGNGNDALYGGNGNDRLWGQNGDDALYGSLGADAHEGEEGRDTFIYRTAAETVGDVITDFVSGTDQIDLSALSSFVFSEDGPRAKSLWTVQEGNDLRLMGDVSGTPETPSINILLKGLSSLSATDILGVSGVLRDGVLDLRSRDTGLTLNLGAEPEGPSPIHHVIGTAHADTITGDGLANRLEGRGGRDTLRGEGGNDTLIGGAGDDTLIGGLGADTLTGGADRNTFVYHSVAETVGDTITDFVSGEDTIDLSAIGTFVFSEDGPRENALWTVQEGNDLRLMGDVSGTPHAPEINILFKNISTLTAADVGADVVRDGTLDVSARMVGAKLHLDDYPGLHKAIGTNQDDRLVGTDRDNTLHGRDGQDRMYGEGWDDHLYGEDGDDFLQGGEGHDYLDGGADVDTADYSDHSTPVGVILRGARATKVRVDGQVEDTLVNIENVTGGSGDDRLVGDNEANVLKGLSGDDKLYGRGGNDILVGGHDKDYMDGGAGVDTADYSGRYGSIEVTLNGSRKVKVLVDGEEEDTIRNIENVIGGFFDDTLVGDDADNTFTGGEGYDTLTGNGGRDTFVYRTAEETVGDVITDFTSGEDVIDFSALEPLLFSANGARANSVWAAQDGNGHLKVLGDTDGDTSTYEIDMTLEGVSTITAADLRLGLSLNGDVLDARSVTDPRYLNISEQQDIRVVQAGGMGHVIRGNALNNILVGGAQGDTFTGGGGTDTFVGDATSAAQDVITDFSVEDGDILQIVSATPLTFADTTPTAHGTWYEAGDDNVTVYADANGDGVADASWVLQGQSTVSAASVQVIAEAPTFDMQPAAVPVIGPASASSSSSVRLDFSTSEHGVAVSLADPSGDDEPELPEDGEWSTIVRASSGESEVMGSPHPDWIVGNDEANVLNGSDEDDVIYGLGGADTLTGGAGEDRFVYQCAEEGGDTITDFTSGEDTIDLSVMAEDCGALEWSEGGSLEYGVWQEASPTGNGMTLYADTDGDAVADFQVTLVGVRSLDKENVFLGEGW